LGEVAAIRSVAAAFLTLPYQAVRAAAQHVDLLVKPLDPGRPSSAVWCSSTNQATTKAVIVPTFRMRRVGTFILGRPLGVESPIVV
jgi:hypothetical protein